jgi:hypothetical protein
LQITWIREPGNTFEESGRQMRLQWVKWPFTTFCSAHDIDLQFSESVVWCLSHMWYIFPRVVVQFLFLTSTLWIVLPFCYMLKGNVCPNSIQFITKRLPAIYWSMRVFKWLLFILSQCMSIFICLFAPLLYDTIRSSGCIVSSLTV